MDALVPAFIAALFCQATDRTAWLAAILADRYRRPGIVALAALIATALLSSIAATAGALLQPMLTPNARLLFLALALLMGGTSLLPLKAPERLAGWRLGGFLTPLLGLAILAAGDRTQFFTLAFAARADLPLLAAIGATLGSTVAMAAAAHAGEAAWRRLPLYPMRVAGGAVSLVAGAILAASALRLV